MTPASREVLAVQSYAASAQVHFGAKKECKGKVLFGKVGVGIQLYYQAISWDDILVDEFLLEVWILRSGLRRKAALIAGFGMFALLAGGVAQAQKAVMTIHPGKGVGGLSLGDGVTQFEAVFPKTPGGWNHDSTGGGKGCPKDFYYWYNRVQHSSALKAYMMGGQISLITVTGPKFSLPTGIVPLYWSKGHPVGTSLKQVQKAYPDGHLYSLTGTDSNLVNGRGLQYWVDGKAGIAFLLVWVPSEKQRMVQGIDVFAPGTAYLPRGCVTVEEKYTEVH